MFMKDKHYWSQLRSALTAGNWSATHPAKAPNGVALSWSELFRKFNKHCPGYRDVAEIASQTRNLAILLTTTSNNDDLDDVAIPNDFPLELGTECMLPQEHIASGATAYSTLKGIHASKFDDTLNFTLAYYAYALGNPSECLQHLDRVSDVLLIDSHIPATPSTQSSARTLQVPSARTETSVSSASGSFISDYSLAIPEIQDGRGWALTESIRSICLQGMSREKLLADTPQVALDSYRVAIPLLKIAQSSFSQLPPSSNGKITFTSFSHSRELWRWVERILWRAVVLSSQTSDVHQMENAEGGASLWTWLKHYSDCSALWPPNFCTAHRSTVSVLYLRALITRHGKATISTSHLDPEKPPPWLHTARLVIQDYRAVLSASTSFPRAGTRNRKVEDFVDLCVAVWEAAGGLGEHAGWVIDVLWWATRLTFNSPRVFRHMTRLFYTSGDPALAARTLQLYAQVVGKAWQTRTTEPGQLELSTDVDTDRLWVETLTAGARMLCKWASSLPGREGIERVRDAGDYIQKAKTRLDSTNDELCASVHLAEAVWHLVSIRKEQDNHTRTDRLVSAHGLLLRASERHPTPSSHFHMALSFAIPSPHQDLLLAIEHAGLAVEGDPREIRFWHLLGLLLSATEQWKSAEEILLQGAAVTDGLGQGDTESVIGTANPEGDGVTLLVPPQTPEVMGNGHINALVSDAKVQDNASDSDSTASELQPPTYVLWPGASRIPPASELLKPWLDHPPPSRQEFFEHALQLRMTQVALAEKVEGAEGAEVKWLEIFTWIAERKGAQSAAPTPRASMDGGRPDEIASLEKPTPQMSAHPMSTNAGVATAESLVPPGGASFAGASQPSVSISNTTPRGEVPAEKKSSTTTSKKGRGSRVKRSYSNDRDASKGKKVHQMLINRVHKEQVRITTISRKIGHGVVRNGSLRRSNSTPDFHAVLRQTSYQASSIHSRRRLSSLIGTHEEKPSESPPPPPPPPPNMPSEKVLKRNSRIARENKLLSDLWLMSAATFRRLGKIEQAKGAIQEAEVKDQTNPAVWVQLGLYYMALGQNQSAVDSLQKALFLSPDDVAASVHLARLSLCSDEGSRQRPSQDGVDLAAGILARLSQGPAWDVPEAWYFLAKAYGLQGRKARERESLRLALDLSGKRGVREIGSAVGWCV